ncbi:jg8966 [Pararge aegeria aegeria]|uniref:Jg8966 protein n=1 Tax=Pararge aegeria aegeria TaxID=348720 RepID=A0A8S4S732_9NEOP|nr:jg8966 [Pararge aegeria aegeria]
MKDTALEFVVALALVEQFVGFQDCRDLPLSSDFRQSYNIPAQLAHHFFQLYHLVVARSSRRSWHRNIGRKFLTLFAPPLPVPEIVEQPRPLLGWSATRDCGLLYIPITVMPSNDHTVQADCDGRARLLAIIKE